MSKFLQRILVILTVVMLPMTIWADDYQLPDPSFEDWSGAAFDGNIQPKYWHASNVEQSALGMSFKFNFANREAGHTGNYCIMAQDQVVGAAGITETSPSYYSLGYGWQYLEGLNTGSATAGTKGGYAFTHRPDSISIWIKRTGNNVDKEDFHVLYYAWTETAKGSSYKNKSGSCTSTTVEDEESDIRILLNGNECKTDKAGGQVCEGWWRERKAYGQWTNLRIPIYYINDNTPKKCNLILSASNYPNFRANDGLYEGNALYVDDVELIYSSKIQTLKVGGKEWKGFDPNSTEVQVFSVPEGTTVIPSIEAFRGAGSLTNPRGTTKDFPGRKLTGSEITITNGTVGGTPTTIVVKAEDGSSTTTYKILFQAAKSSNAKLANIYYTYTNINNEQVRAAVSNFSPSTYNYKVELPYGSQGVPKVEAEKQEDEQTIAYSQPASLADKATITVTAANGTSKQTYNLTFEIGKLADNTLKDIQVNGKSVPGFTPSQAVYKVSLPTSTTTMPTVTPVSAYADGEQTIVHKAPATIDGGTYTLSVTTPGNTVAKVYKLNFKLEASSYSYLKDLKVGDYIKNFDPQNTTYYVNLPLGTTTLPGITAIPGDEYQKIVTSDLGAGVVDGTVRVTVTAGNGDQTVYKIVFSTEKSERSTLKGIQIGGVDLPGFDPDVTNYTYALGVGVDKLPEITPIPGDEYQTISVTTAGLNGKTRITVTAGNGTTTIYIIAFSVETFTDNTLASLAVEGDTLRNSKGEAVDFDPEVNEYWVNLPQGTSVRPEVKWTPAAEEPLQYVSERPFTGLNGDYKITVRPESGASRTYIIHFSVATSSNTDLLMIYLNGGEIPGFRSDSLNYIDSLPEGITTIPTVTYKKAEETQRVLSVLEGKTQKITVTAESGAKKEYTVKFVPRASANAYLNMIYLDGVVLPGFKKEVLEYSYPMTGETCPAITVDKAPGQQVTITAPYGAGKATIVVLPEDGAGNTYTIHFTQAPAQTVQLAAILIDGKKIAGFKADSTTYKATYEKVLPTVSYIKGDEAAQTVQVLWKDSVAWLHVVDTLGNKAAYNVTFTRIYSSNNALEGIYADGVLIPGFDAATLNYSYDLTAGSAYPEITYKAKDDAEVVFFGQLAAGKWGITVTAEDGTIANYTVQYNLAKYADATLKKMSVVDKTLSPAFDSNIFSYNVNIDEGEALPKILVETREGQTVYINNVDADHQEVTVFAESGANNTYNIAYTRSVSSNALLADILIDGVSLAGFDSEVFNYVDSLDRKDAESKPTTVIPNVFPVGQLSNQTITTYFSKPNGTTKIHVEAQDGTTQDYFISFPVRKSNNNFLGGLYLSSDYDVDITFKKTTTEYVVTLPYAATECPLVVFEKDEAEQRIDFISRPIGDTTKVIVVAENGESRTYNILFKREVLKTKNLLASIYIPEIDKNLSLKNKDQRSFDVTLPYGARTLTVEYEKSYDEQTVFIEPGGVNEPTRITVKANNDTVADEVYVLNPIKTTQNPAVLNSIEVDDVPVDDFDPNRFTYIVNRTATTLPKVKVTRSSGVEYDYESSYQKWEATVTKDGYTSVYKIFFHYPNDIIPNGEFTNWSKTSKSKSDKPTGWNAPGDCFDTYAWTVKAAESVVKESASVVHLTNFYWAALYGPLPSVINLGDLECSPAVAAQSKTVPNGFISYHNTPDVAKINYKYTKKAGDGALFRFKFFDSDGNEHPYDHRQSSTKSSYAEYTLNLGTDGIGVTGMDIIIDASGQYPKGANDADLYVDYIRFSFNSTPKAAKVNDIDAVLNDKEFTVTLTDPEDVNIRSYEFNGQVSDQAQLLNWSAPVKGADFETRSATFRNFAEDGTYTDGYSLVVKRPLDTKNQLKDLLVDSVSITGFNPTKTEYTIHMPVTRRNMNDLVPIPASSLQKVTTAFADSTMTITVTPEKGETTTYTVKFVTDLSDDTTLKSLNAEGVTYDPAVDTYDIYTKNWPLISYQRNSDKQVVELVNGVITVTAENGATGTYTINRHDPSETTTAVIKEFALGTNIITGFGGDVTVRNEAKPADPVLFERECSADSVVFVQTPDSMEWLVYGSVNNRYIWRYPTELSNNAYLANITQDGADLADFVKTNFEYDITSDSTTVLSSFVADEGQTLVTSIQEVEGGVEYIAEVTAENGVNKNIYKITVKRPMSNIATLDSILLDDMMVEGFAPTTMVYDVTLPVPAVKTAEPKMPNITYAVGHPGQKVTVEQLGTLNGDQTILAVESEDGSTTERYYLTIASQKSSCVDLTGITVNGEPVDHFEPGRHFYSTSLNTEDIVIDYTADDRFLKVEHVIDTVTPHHALNYTLHVIAEDGSTSDYLIEIYIENQSNDAHLANITLDGKNFEDFERALNLDLTFDPGNNNYEINLPSGTTIVPEVSAQLKMDGQQVEIIHKVNPTTNFTDSILLNVTAVDGVEKNTYTLKFLVPLSTNADLSMIFLDGDSLKNFDPTYYFYQVELPVGVHTMPEVAAQKGEAGQTIKSIEIDQDKLQATIKVLAEDKTVRENTYVVVFHLTQSEEDKLDMIYEDGKPLSGFDENTMYYTLSLPVGTSNFPDLGWLEKDDYQTIAMDTVEATLNTLIRQIIVTSESGKKNTYTVSYTIEKSDVDTLQMLFIDHKPLANFEGKTVVYLDTLSAAYAAELAGQLPIVEYTVGDEYQTVLVSQVPEDELSEKSLGYKSIITVTAATGKTRIYTIHYPVELSNDATLNMINVSAKPLANYDAERFNYRLEIAKEASVPVVTVIKKEEAQTYEIRALGDTVQIVVWAESKKDSAIYTLTFERLKSANTMLRDIILTDINTGERLPSSEFPYRPEVYSYIVNVPYDSKKELISLIPTIEPEFYEEEQTADTTVHYLPDGDIQIDITVTAANEEDQAIYSIIFHFVKPADATLASLTIKGEEFIDFRPTKTEYVYAHPYGTDPADYFTIDEVKYVLSDSLAVDTMYMDESGVINIVVVAQDGRTSMTYLISQITAEDGDNALAWITIDGDTIPGFDPEVLFYTYYVFESDMPSLNAEPRSENADVDKGRVTAGDTTTIICTAADGSERYYYVYFAITTVNPGDVATSGDVLIKRVPGAMQLAAYTVRQGVSIALYDQYGHLLYNERIPVANPNDTEIVEDSDQKEFLNNVDDLRSGLIIDVLPGQPYFYCFYYNGKKKLASGKIMCY